VRFLVKLNGKEIEKIEELAERIGREDKAVTPMQIRSEMGWTARQWGERKHEVLAAGVNVVHATEIRRRNEDAVRGARNLRILEWVFFKGHREELIYDTKRPTATLRSLGAGKVDAVGILRMARAGRDDDHAPMYEEEEKMTVRALKIEWETWTAMKEFYRKQREDRAKESEAAEEERRKRAEAEKERELDELAGGKA